MRANANNILTAAPAPIVGLRLADPLPSRRGQPLSDREAEVAMHLCDGKTKKEIAAALFVSVKTVEKHVQAVHAKWGCRNTVEVLKYAVRNGHYDLRVWEGNPT